MDWINPTLPSKNPAQSDQIKVYPTFEIKKFPELLSLSTNSRRLAKFASNFPRLSVLKFESWNLIILWPVRRSFFVRRSFNEGGSESGRLLLGTFLGIIYEWLN